MKPVKLSILIPILMACVFMHKASDAYTIPNECIDANWALNGGNGVWPVLNVEDNDTIWIYIEDDFASEVQSCTPQNDSQINENMARAVILSAAETWNMESRGVNFRYGGTFPASDNERGLGICNIPANEPAVFVVFNKGCALMPDNVTCATARARVRESICDQPINKTRFIVQVFGDFDGAATPLGVDQINCDGVNNRAWTLGFGNLGVAQNADMQETLTHEFGHILDLGHLSSTDGDVSVMGVGANGVLTRHVYPFDQECLPVESNIREIDYGYAGYSDYSGTADSGSWGSINDVFLNTDQQMISSGHLRSITGLEYYGRYESDTLRYGTVGNSSNLSFSSTSFPSALVRNLNSYPILYSPKEQTASSYNRAIRINFTSTDENDIPPRSRYFRSGNFFSTGEVGTFASCNRFLTNPCSSIVSPIESHLPMTTTWNDDENITIFAHVNTDRTDPNQGSISIHPGFHNDTSTNILRSPAIVTANAPDNYNTPPYSYQGITESPVGLACAPNRSEYNHNCLVAWRDIGVPVGRILYRYFNVECSGNLCDVNFHGTTYARGIEGSAATSTVGGISAAWFDGRFWMTWKSYDGTVRVFYNDGGSVGGSRTAWKEETSFNTERTSHTPSFFYIPEKTKRSGLIWSY